MGEIEQLIARLHRLGAPFHDDDNLWKITSAAADTIEALQAENERLRELLRWAKTCVPFPSDCHAAINAALKGEGKDD